MNRCRAFLLFALSGLLSTAGAAEALKPITLGAVYNTTGQQAVLDQTSVQGAQLAARDASVLGRPLDLVFLNGQSDVKVTAEIVAEFIKGHPDVPALFGVSDSDLARATGKAAAKAKLLFLTSGATSPQLPAEVPTYLYLACFGDNEQAAAGAQWAYDKLGSRSVAVVFDTRYTYTQLLHEYFQEAFTGMGGKVVSVTSFDEVDAIDTDAIGEADLIFLSTEATNEAANAVQALRKAGLTQPILGGDGYDTPTVWAMNPNVRDVYYTTHAYIALDNPDPRVQAFYKAYTKAYEGLKPDSFAALAYDSIGLLVDAMERAGSTDPEAVRQALGQTKDYPGVTGSISYIDGSHIPQKPVALIAIKDGGISLVEEVTPKNIPKP